MHPQVNNKPPCYDKGDCCKSVCKGYSCGSTSFNCLDPKARPALSQSSAAVCAAVTYSAC